MSHSPRDSMTTFDARLCTGCRTCEMACSYHHAGVFQPSEASIEITGGPKEGFRIALYGVPREGRIPCDGCRELEDPLCVAFCPAVARSELRGFIGRLRESRIG